MTKNCYLLSPESCKFLAKKFSDFALIFAFFLLLLHECFKIYGPVRALTNVASLKQQSQIFGRWVKRYYIAEILFFGHEMNSNCLMLHRKGKKKLLLLAITISPLEARKSRVKREFSGKNCVAWAAGMVGRKWSTCGSGWQEKCTWTWQ